MRIADAMGRIDEDFDRLAELVLAQEVSEMFGFELAVRLERLSIE